MTDIDLNSLLDQQKEHLNVLLSLLRQEISALSSRQPDELEQLGQKKIACLEALQQLDQRIANHPQLTALRESPAFQQSVAEMDAVLADCKQQNEVNRLAFEQSQLNLQHFKNELLQLHGKSGLTYDRKGKPAVEHKGKGFKA